MRRRALGRTAAVVGVGTTRFGDLSGLTCDDMASIALERALSDAQLGVKDVDGLVTMRVSGYEAIAGRFGIDAAWATQVPAEGRMTGPAIQSAVMAIDAGLCHTVALVYGNDGRSGGHTYGGQGAQSSAAAEGYGTSPALALRHGLTSPGAFYAMLLQRHSSLFGTTAEQLAEVAMAFRHHARLNDSAMMRKAMNVSDYLDSRYIVRPLRLFDYCLINDGGVAMIITKAELAPDVHDRPVFVRGFGQRGSLSASDYPPDDFWNEALGQAGAGARRMADVDRGDIDLLLAYDNFSPNVLFTLEGLGFCQPGEAGEWIQGGRIRLGGELPTNTSGGHLSESYMQGWSLNVEAIRQLRGEAGDRQVEGATVAQYAAAAPISSSVIYSRDPS